MTHVKNAIEALIHSTIAKGSMEKVKSICERADFPQSIKKDSERIYTETLKLNAKLRLLEKEITKG